MTWTTAQQEALLQLASQRTERNRLVEQLSRAQNELQAQQNWRVLLYDQWQTEQADVDRLTSLSWTSLYYSLTNQKAEQLDKEETELQQAQQRYDAVRHTIVQLQQQVDTLTVQLAQCTDVDAAYEELLTRKRLHLLAQPGGDAAQRYLHYMTTLTDANSELQSLYEAYQAGQDALREVTHTRQLIDQAYALGHRDAVGGTVISSLAKYRKLDEVRAQSHRLTHYVTAFQSRFQGLNQPMTLDSTFVDMTTRVMDIFFDNVFTDLAVHARIRQAVTDSRKLAHQLILASDTIKRQLDQTTARISQVTTELHQFLENA